MFDYDKWQEIFMTMRHNKLRTFLTMFSLTWGMFMIILLIGLGNSFRDGVSKEFDNWANNAGFMWGQVTTISHNGFQPGKPIRFTELDTKSLLKNIEGLKYISPRNQRDRLVNNTKDMNIKGLNLDVYGDFPNYIKIESLNFVQGRFFNQKDIDKKRNVAVIGKRVADLLFEDIKSPIGEYISIQNVNFKVIGISEAVRDDPEGDDENYVSLPFTTFEKVFKTKGKVGWYAFAAREGYNVEKVLNKMVEILKENHSVSPLDEEAIGSFNLSEKIEEVLGIFKGMKLFVLFIGISMLFSGILGISNIMLIIVKERTKEIGIRKSLGATNSSIIGLILQESTFLTLIGGIIGLLFAHLLIDVINLFLIPNMGRAPFEMIYVSNGMMLGTLMLLIIGGLCAGVVPALRATKIHPVEAMRQG